MDDKEIRVQLNRIESRLLGLQRFAVFTAGLVVYGWLFTIIDLTGTHWIISLIAYGLMTVACLGACWFASKIVGLPWRNSNPDTTR